MNERMTLAEMKDVFDAVSKPITPPQWIKCSERMPEDDRDFLIWGAKCGLMIGYWDGDRWNQCDYSDSYLADQYQPTHWQPLPEPPEEGE